MVDGGRQNASEQNTSRFAVHRNPSIW